MKYLRNVPHACVLALLCSVTSHAATVYKTVNEDGSTSFSDTKPATDAPVEKMKIDVQQSSLSPQEQQQRLDDMRESTDRMASDRMEREQHRAELQAKQQKQQQQQQAASQQPDYTDYMGYSSGYSRYSGYPVRRPVRRPGLRPIPGHPIARPPIRPGPSRPISRPRR
jgi:TolA-binding protein